MAQSKVYYIPTGPKNLAVLFPDIDWSKVDKYYVRIKNESATVIAETNVFKLGCCCDQDRIRVHFYNYDGSYDAINFKRPKIIHETISSSYTKGLHYPLDTKDTGAERFNINANDTYEAITTCYTQNDQAWLKELFDSPKVFIEWAGIEGQSDSYVPIIILDTKFEFQNNEEYKFLVTIQFRLGNEFIIIRN